MLWKRGQRAAKLNDKRFAETAVVEYFMCREFSSLVIWEFNDQQGKNIKIVSILNPQDQSKIIQQLGK